MGNNEILKETPFGSFRPVTPEEEKELKKDPLINAALELGGVIAGVSVEKSVIQNDDSSSSSK